MRCLGAWSSSRDRNIMSFGFASSLHKHLAGAVLGLRVFVLIRISQVPGSPWLLGDILGSLNSISLYRDPYHVKIMWTLPDPIDRSIFEISRGGLTYGNNEHSCKRMTMASNGKSCLLLSFTSIDRHDFRSIYIIIMSLSLYFSFSFDVLVG